MLKRGQIKKRIYRSKGSRKVRLENIYMKFWPSMMPYVEKYNCFDGHPMSFSNCPIYKTAVEIEAAQKRFAKSQKKLAKKGRPRWETSDMFKPSIDY